jgi:hypothetical protein
MTLGQHQHVTLEWPVMQVSALSNIGSDFPDFQAGSQERLVRG